MNSKYSKLSRQISFLILAAALFVVPTQAQTVLYTNGSLDGTTTARNISFFYQVADSFTLTTESVIKSVTLGVWDSTGDSLVSLHWAITTAPLGGVTLASGDASTTDVFQFNNNQGYDIYTDTFATISTELSSGTYWLQVGNATTAWSGNNANWDQNSGSSLAYQSTAGQVPSEYFELSGTTTPVPEPSAFALFWLALLLCSPPVLSSRSSHRLISGSPHRPTRPYSSAGASFVLGNFSYFPERFS